MAPSLPPFHSPIFFLAPTTVFSCTLACKQAPEVRACLLLCPQHLPLCLAQGRRLAKICCMNEMPSKELSTQQAFKNGSSSLFPPPPTKVQADRPPRSIGPVLIRRGQFLLGGVVRFISSLRLESGFASLSMSLAPPCLLPHPRSQTGSLRVNSRMPPHHLAGTGAGNFLFHFPGVLSQAG